jgi:hypothetical protein
LVDFRLLRKGTGKYPQGIGFEDILPNTKSIDAQVPYT